MKNRLCAISVALLLAACASTHPTYDRFELMAEEWQGAHVDEMLAKWGDPQETELPNEESGTEIGHLKWIIDVRPNGGIDGTAARRSHCEVTAWFGTDGFIYDIDVISNNCAKLARGSYFRSVDVARP